MLAALEAIKESCSEEINMNTTYAEDDDLKTLAESIEKQLCPNECSNFGDAVHGQCNNGTGAFDYKVFCY